MKVFLIMNPGSRDGKSEALFDRIFENFEKHKIDYEYKTTTTLKDAYEFSKSANEAKKYDAIVAVGGDGTINQTLTGFFNREGLRISNSKMGILYTGTSPDFCRSYNIPLDMEEAVKVIAKDNSTRISIGRIVMMDSSSIDYDNKFIEELEGHKTAYFGCCANIGLGAALARKANTGIRKKLGDFLGTFLSLIQIIFTYKASDFKTRIDGKIGTVKRLGNISIGKTRFIASGIQLVNEIKLIDKRFYVFSVRKLSFFRWLQVLITVYSGRPFSNRGYMSLEYAQQIEIAGNYKNSEVEYDGDPAGYLPCHIETAKEPLEILCGVSK